VQSLNNNPSFRFPAACSNSSTLIERMRGGAPSEPGTQRTTQVAFSSSNPVSSRPERAKNCRVVTSPEEASTRKTLNL
jgi:hypothetical protein